MPLIPGLEPDAQLLLSGVRSVSLKAGQPVFQPGQVCSAFLLVTAGSVKVSTSTESGRELLLYRVGAGNTCVLTTACLLSGSDYDAAGSAETNGEAVVIPRALFESLLATSPAFRRFVFSSYGERLRDLIGLVQEVSQRQLDRRLARFLEGRAALPISLTHQEIAAELGTAREVVSRLLKQFADEGLVTLDRRNIAVIDREGLARIAAGV